MNKKFIAAILAGFAIFFGTQSAFADTGFYVTKIDDKIFAKIKGKSFKDNCTLPVEDLNGNAYIADDLRDNNSSCFNFRFISHTKRISKHGLGLAVDINTLYNPYIKYLADGTRVLEPATAEIYLDRDKNFPYKITENDLCYKLFTEHGFEW